MGVPIKKLALEGAVSAGIRNSAGYRLREAGTFSVTSLSFDSS